ncbi:MAG: hypothetical protein JSS75_13395 [Bacteroidetes bacterium]|nr:hypothetical protein [Bacteroidota bacterium]
MPRFGERGIKITGSPRTSFREHVGNSPNLGLLMNDFIAPASPRHVPVFVVMRNGEEIFALFADGSTRGGERLFQQQDYMINFLPSLRSSSVNAIMPPSLNTNQPSVGLATATM